MLLNLLIDYIDNHVNFIHIPTTVFTINLVVGVLFGLAMVAYEWNSYRVDTGKKKQKTKNAPQRKTTTALVNQTTLMDVAATGFLAAWCFALGIIGVLIAVFILSQED